MMKFTAQVLKLDEKSPVTGVIYRKEEMEKVIEEYNKGDFKFGQFGKDNTEFNLSEIASKVDKLRIDGDKVMADIEIADTPKGVICQEIIKSGIKLATAPRFIMEGNNKIVKLVSVDIINDDDKAFEGNTLNVEE